MPKISSIKEFLELIGSVNTAWPIAVSAVAVVVPIVLALPLAALIGIALVLFLAAGLLAYQLRRRFLYMPLLEASRIAYEQLEGTLWAEAAMRMHDKPSPQNTLDYMGQLLVIDIPLFGTRPPSTVFKRIDDDLVKRSVIADNCGTLVSNDPKDLPWAGLAVERSASKRRIKEMLASDASAPRDDVQKSVSLTLPKSIVERFLSKGAEAELPQGDKAQEILETMLQSGDGSLLILSYLEGTRYQVGSGHASKILDARNVALLHEAVGKLEQQGLIRLVREDQSCTMYQVTADGYRRGAAAR